MSKFPAKVRIFEEGPREAFQSEALAIPTADKVRLINALSRTGVDHIQCVSFVDPRRVPGMVDSVDVVNTIDLVDGVEYSALWMNARGLQQALDIPHLKVDGKIRIYPSEVFLKENLGRTFEDHFQKNVEVIELCKSRGISVTQASVASAFGCNFQGDMDLAAIIGMIEQTVQLFRTHELELQELSLADTMAWATPKAITHYIGAIRNKFPQLELRLHLHDTRGMGLANAYAGLQMGVNRFDTSVGGLGGCPFANHKSAAGNICTEDFVHMCHEMDVETGVDLEAMIEAARVASEVVGRRLPSKTATAGTIPELRRRLQAARIGEGSTPREVSAEYV